LLVKVHAIDRVAVGPVISRLDERAVVAAAMVELFDKILRHLRDDLDEDEYLTRGRQVSYLTCLRGRQFEQAHHDWCLRAAEVLRARVAAA
jgi:hypothetical protein